jgi:hypothetical protein
VASGGVEVFAEIVEDVGLSPADAQPPAIAQFLEVVIRVLGLDDWIAAVPTCPGVLRASQ